MKVKHVLAILLTLSASILPDVLYPSPSVIIFKIIFMVCAAAGLLFFDKFRHLSKFSIVLLMMNGSQLLTDTIGETGLWKGVFSYDSFFINIERTVALKLIGIFPVIAVLLILLKNRDAFYFKQGDLSIKAHSIRWLGIEKETMSWGKLSVISGVLIALGTILLTLITSTGFKLPNEIDRLLPNLPLILVLAFVNSFCEGVIFRNAMMGPLRDHFSKDFTVMISALFFGIAHYQGIPGGSLGAVMSGLLGWYMARSMYETHGYAAAWRIHFMQDVTIFSTLLVLSG